jgi:hypothetical protein
MPPRNGHANPRCLVFPFRLLSFDPHPCAATHVTALESTQASDYESGAQEFGLRSIQSKGGADGRRYALVHLEGKWETVDEDRVSLPEKQDQ